MFAALLGCGAFGIDANPVAGIQQVKKPPLPSNP